MQPDIVSAARFADMAEIHQARAMSPEEKFFAGARLFEEDCERLKETLRKENPGSDEDEIYTMLGKRLHMARLEKEAALYEVNKRTSNSQ
jgi:hypothetical protein